MLVVSRRPGQSVLIGQDIEVFVLEVQGSQVRVGINAPRKVRVLRRELVAQVENENRRALGNRASAEETLSELAAALGPEGPRPS